MFKGCLLRLGCNRVCGGYRLEMVVSRVTHSGLAGEGWS